MMASTGKRVISAWLLAMLAALSILLQGCMGSAVGSDAKSEADPDPAIPVEAATVSSGDVAAFYTGTATLEADEQATVVSQITGVVLPVDGGITAGDPVNHLRELFEARERALAE